MIKHIPISIQKKLVTYQKAMRRRPTKAEKQFQVEVLNVLRGRYNIKYVSRKLIWELKNLEDKKGYILDFYLPTLKIAIEVDGASHQGKRAKDYDAIRDSLCAKKGIRVVRFTNKEVKNSGNCLRRMYQEIEDWFLSRLSQWSKSPVVQIDREIELKLQEEFIKTRDIKKLPSVGINRKAVY